MTDNGWVRKTVAVLSLALLVSCAPGRSNDAAQSRKSPVAPVVQNALNGPAAVLIDPVPLPAVTTTVAPSTAEVIVVIDGTLRSALVHTPEQIVSDTTPAKLMPLVIALHGSDGSGADMEALTGFDEVADRESFIVAYADGLLADAGYGLARSWNSGGCCEPATSVGVDDVDFLSRLIDRLIERYPVDAERVFVVGHSNGAIMAQKLGCRMADRLAGIVSVSGALDDTQSCQPDRAVPFLEIHGTYDANVSFGAGESSVTAWRSFNRCTYRSEQTSDGAVSTTTWDECANDAKVAFISIDGAEHPWPSRRTPTNDDLRVSFALDATEATWAFFSSVSPVQTASNRG